VPFDVRARDLAANAYRREVYQALDIVLFPHQAEWQLATEGYALIDATPTAGDRYTTIRVPDETDLTFTREHRSQRTLTVSRVVVPRYPDENGIGTVAHHAADLAGFKAGKSWGGAAWLTGFAIVPDAHVQLIGAEYSTSSIWTTTADEPWVSVIHDRAHGVDPDWHCTCGIDSSCNPFTHDQRARDRDDPDKGGIMTRERFEIAYKGRLGAFVGRCYESYQRGSQQFSPMSHPDIWKPFDAVV
jgi:hypothetical protein